MPTFDHRERHSRWIDAPPERVWSALDQLRVGDLPLTTLLARLRGMSGGPLDKRALDAVAPRPMAEDPPRELLLGDIARYTARTPARPPTVDRGDLAAFVDFDEPGWSKVAMNFRLTPERGGTRLSTETRVRSTDPATRRTFRLYWLFIRFGSGLIRHDILHAVDAKA